jgi:hypothetical protein
VFGSQGVRTSDQRLPFQRSANGWFGQYGGTLVIPPTAMQDLPDVHDTELSDV